MTPNSLRGGVAAALLCALSSTSSGQAPPAAEPYAIRNVRTGVAEDAPRATLILRDGRVDAVLEHDAALPPRVRIVEGDELIALPAFVDAFTRAGSDTPEPVIDQDRPVDVREDVRVDMRRANRKGIQPTFRAVDAIALDEGTVGSWNARGFGAVLSAPSGELLAGWSALATVREAATRDLIVAPAVHAHAAFNASGGGYPSTLMGYHAQLRQFFLDAQHHTQLTNRYAQGRPGARPAHDQELAAGAELLAGEQVLWCEAETARDAERWMRLADEFGLRIALCGGRDVWKVADMLAVRRIPVVLTLDWGEEVEDPSPDESNEEAQDDAEDSGERSEDAEPDGKKGADKSDDDPWTYEEPLGVQQERRREWEERRDCALRLHEAGVEFAFGTGDRKPSELLENVRTAVAAGLPAEVAQAALTTKAARLVGAQRHLGAIAPGMDASLCLWTGDPFTDKRAEPAWIFVDGFATKRELKAKKGKGASAEGPDEGVDATGTWTITVDSDDAPESAVLTLVMEEDGAVTGRYAIALRTGMAGESDVEGSVSGDEMTLRGVFALEEAEIEFELTATIAGDAMTGTSVVTMPWAEESVSSSFTAAKTPERDGGVR